MASPGSASAAASLIDPTERVRRRLAAGMCLAALAATAVGLYLGLTKLAGAAPVCGPVEGCGTVAASEYSSLLGVPTGLLGAAGSLFTLIAAVAWWRRRSAAGLYGAYLLGLVSLPMLAWLTYLELFVIRAVCIWCVTYAILVIVGWILATRALLLRSRFD